MARINAGNFRAQVLKGATGKLDKKAFEIASERFEARKVALVEAFENHPVTQEIKLGADAPDLSGATRGYGNLYTFIGFHDEDGEADAHLQEIQDLLETAVTLRKTPQTNVNGTKFRWQFGIFIPTEKTFEDLTPMPWGTGSSWLLGLEKVGISGLNYYLYGQFEASRSTGGLQTRKVVRPGTFKRVPYVLAMLEKFRQSFN